MEEGGQMKDAPTVFVSNKHPKGLFTHTHTLPWIMQGHLSPTLSPLSLRATVTL